MQHETPRRTWLVGMPAGRGVDCPGFDPALPVERFDAVDNPADFALERQAAFAVASIVGEPALPWRGLERRLGRR